MSLSSEGVNSLDFDENNQAFRVDRRLDGVFLQTIDMQTGQVTDVGDMGPVTVTGIAFDPSVTAVPEPSSIAFMTTVTIGLIARRRKLRWLRSPHYRDPKNPPN